MTERKSQIHQSIVGTYHPAPDSEVGWTVHDSQGYGGMSCDDCGECDCSMCENCPDETHLACACEREDADNECIGLSFSYVCLDGGDNLCEECFEKDDTVEVVPCNCP